MESKRIAVYGGSHNPSGLHHRTAARSLAERFDEVIVVPCGGRPDKGAVSMVEPVHRAIMADLTFGDIPGVRVDHFDIENAAFTRAHRVEERYASQGEVWHAIGADILSGHGLGSSEFRNWERAEHLWQNGRFAVIERAGYPLKASDLPPRHELLAGNPTVTSSTEIRERLAAGRSIHDLVSPRVREHLERYGLYSGRLPTRHTVIRRERPRVLIETADFSDRAKRIAERFAAFEDRRDPDFILAVGGDGTMLHAIQQHWRRRLPFVGVNAGTRGYLMNGSDLVGDPLEFLSRLNVVLQPMLYAEFETVEGRVVKANAFNDVWLERLGGQSSWLRVEVGDEVRVSRLVADGVLLATPAGSTAYARSLGATPLLVDANAFLIVGNNVSEPNWKSAVLSPDVTVRITNLDPAKRPVRGYADGQDIGPVVAVTVRLSQAAAAELAFSPERDMARKLMDDQFPDLVS